MYNLEDCLKINKQQLLKIKAWKQWNIQQSIPKKYNSLYLNQEFMIDQKYKSIIKPAMTLTVPNIHNMHPLPSTPVKDSLEGPQFNHQLTTKTAER